MAAADARSTNSGVVELREDVPLKVAHSSGGAGGGGVRALVACFAALSVGVTVALLAQIWSGSAQVSVHGAAVAGACSGAAAGVLRAAGSAADAAVAAALCLAVLQPEHVTLNSSGAVVYWEYRLKHGQPPLVLEWGEAAPPRAVPAEVPRLLAALAALHAQFGKLPWSAALQPALSLALNGGAPPSKAGAALSPPASPLASPLAATLAAVQHNTSAELWAQWSSSVAVRQYPAPAQPVAGRWTLYAGGAGAARAAALLQPLTDSETSDTVIASVVRRMWAAGAAAAARGAAAALADTAGTYAALVAGDAAPAPAAAPLDLTAAIMVDGTVCGSRYVLSSADSGGLAQVAAALVAGAAPAPAVESARVAVRGGPSVPALQLEPGRLQPPPPPTGVLPVPAPAPLPAVAVLRQAGDALAGHADSRAGGLAARF